MTRDEAIAKVHDAMSQPGPHTHGFVDALVSLGLIKLETREEASAEAAVRRLTNVIVMTDSAVKDSRVDHMPRKLTHGGATEIIDVLVKSGFRITRDK